MTHYYSSPLSIPQSGTSTIILDNKFSVNGIIRNKVTIEDLNSNADVKNLNLKTYNNSKSLLQNSAFNRFTSVKPSVFYSLR